MQQSRTISSVKFELSDWQLSLISRYWAGLYLVSNDGVKGGNWYSHLQHWYTQYWLRLFDVELAHIARCLAFQWRHLTFFQKFSNFPRNFPVLRSSQFPLRIFFRVLFFWALSSQLLILTPKHPWNGDTARPTRENALQKVAATARELVWSKVSRETL